MSNPIPSLTSRVLRARPDLRPRLPHPSWRESIAPPAADGAATIDSAGDFWSRLGL
ncbi:hypothetical protein [Novosphingobium soli]|uniref:Uncharacterized protein n=1 Tax=Novosphingobium soli TaxID=574956 RepID=A0ABV6CW36_9SPHN